MPIPVDVLKLHFVSAFLALFVLALVGCGGTEGESTATQNRAALLPGKVGPSGEIVMVVSESDWNRGVGAAVDSIFREPVRVLPQYEPRFDVIRLDPEEFDRFWKPHRNLIVFDIADRVDTQTPDMRVARAQFAKGQIYAEVKAKLIAATLVTQVGDPQLEGDHIGPVVNQRQFQQIQHKIQAGIDEGAVLLAGGPGRPE